MSLKNPDPIDFGDSSYWDIIESALVGLPETDRLRKPALDALDHLKERVLAAFGDRHTQEQA